MKNLILAFSLAFSAPIWSQVESNLIFPEETDFVKISNSMYSISLPNGHTFVFVDENGVSSYGGTGLCYNCSGTCSDGCNVQYVRGFSCDACEDGVPGDFNECTGKYVKCETSETPTEIYMFNMDAGIKFIDDINELAGLNQVAFTSEVISLLQVEAAFRTFNQQIYGTENPTEELIESLNCVLLPMNAYGNLIGYKVPASYINENNIYEGLDVGDGGDKVKCSCTSGTGGCKLSPYFGVYCISGLECTSCTMSISTSFASYMESKE